MDRFAHQSIFLLLLTVIFVQHSKGQKIRTDTVYYDNTGELVTNQSDYLTYEVRELDRKKRVNGKTERYTKSGRLTELTRCVKGEKKGPYYRYNQAGEVIIYGDYDNSLKTGFWVILDNNGSMLMTEEYDDSGKLIQKQDQASFVKADNSSNKLESRANFFGGDVGWNLHLRNNLKYPLGAKRAGYQGYVYMAFTVLSNGKIKDLSVINSPHEILSEEALRMVETSPDWIPAMIDEKPVDSQVIKRIEFRLR